MSIQFNEIESKALEVAGLSIAMDEYFELSEEDRLSFGRKLRDEFFNNGCDGPYMDINPYGDALLGAIYAIAGAERERFGPIEIPDGYDAKE